MWRMEIRPVLHYALHITSFREQVTSPFEEAVLEVSFPHSLAEWISMVCNDSDLFLCYNM